MQIKRTKLSLWHSNMAIGNHPLIDDLRINVGCWLVGRLAIVPKKHKLFNYSEPMHCLAASLLWQEILGGAFFCQKKVCGKNLNTFFSEKNLASLHVPKESDRLLNPYWRTVFPQISKALGHERVQFTLVGLFARFTIAANFSRADPGAKRRKAFYTSNCQIQSPNLSHKNQTAY